MPATSPLPGPLGYRGHPDFTKDSMYRDGLGSLVVMATDCDRIMSSNLMPLRVEELLHVKCGQALSPPVGVEARKGDTSSDVVLVT
ncbi:hypothetical protein TNCV_2392821 [Trichonephila clavipes]|nr:hypothetical protein TNCV_2392821 [Trichonephila clavipes]